MYIKILKPLLDFVGASILFIVLIPVSFVTVIMLFVANSGAPFFVQKRPGKNERLFKIIKFRTMNSGKNANGDLLPDAQRLTVVGKFIRSTSIDEIPQLINVIKGEMSLVGPRPLLPEYLPLYNSFQRQRHNVKPGITGYAQVNGRNVISWDKKFELDNYYVKKISFVLDCKIILKTISKVFNRRDINTINKATTERFKGNTDL